MDRIDWKILSELETDGRLSFAELSERVGVSKSPCWQRVRGLENNGVILGYHAQLNPTAMGMPVQCIVEVRVRFDGHAAFEAAVLDHPAVMECHTTAGDSDYLIRVFASSVEHLDGLLRHDLSKIPGVHRLSTKICLKTIKAGVPLSLWAVRHA